MKRMYILLLLLCLLVAGCGKKKEPEETTAPTTVPPTTRETVSREQAEKNRLETYREALENFAFEYRFPDGSTVPVDSAFGSMEGNFFALVDVDGDGEQELVISFAAGPMASMALYVCGYDGEAGALTVMLTEFPSVVFFTNSGFAEAQLSHNQGLAGDALWPYTLYACQNGAYEAAASVDAWDKSFSALDSGGKPFPEDVDADGDGIVYLVTQDGMTRTLDGADYISWRDSLLHGEEPMDVTYRSVTRDNIREAFRE